MIDPSKLTFTPEVNAYGLYSAIIGSLETIATLYTNNELRDPSDSVETWCSWVGNKAAQTDGLTDVDRNDMIERALKTAGPYLPKEFGTLVLAVLGRRAEVVKGMIGTTDGQHRHGVGSRKKF